MQTNIWWRQIRGCLGQEAPGEEIIRNKQVLGVTDLFSILIAVMVLWVYTLIETQIVKVKYTDYHMTITSQ